MLDYFYLFVLLVLLYIGYLIYKSHQQPLSSKNKAVFITGCDTGFGHLFARRMAEKNYRVFAGCLFPEGEGASALKSFSSKIEVVSLDVSDEKSVTEASRTVEFSLGSDDILWAVVNNAGLGHAGEVEWSPMDTILKLFEVNVFGMVRVTQQFLPLLRKSKGRLINLTSIAGVRRLPATVFYCMSKSAASTFSDGIRLEMKKWKIQVINIQPYFYSTQITSEDRVTSYFNQSWKNADSRNTVVLGEEYFQKFVKFYVQMLRVVNCNRVEDVISCLEEAVTSPVPKLYYRPGNLINKLLFDLPNLLPPSVQDFLHNLVTSMHY